MAQTFSNFELLLINDGSTDNTRAIYTQIAVIINTYYTGKLFGLGYWAQLKDFSPYLTSAFLSATPAYLLTFTAIPHFLTLLVGGIAALGIYYILFRNDVHFNEVLSLIKNRGKSK